MVCQGLRQALVEGSVFHIDDHTVDVIEGDLVRQAVGFILRWHGGHGHVTGTIGEQDHQRLNIRVQDTLAQQGLMSHVKPGGEGCLATDRDIRQGTLSEHNRVGGRKDHGCAVLLENDQTHPITALVGVGEQGQDSALGGRHALSDCHRPGGIHNEQHKVGGLFHAHLALEVTGADGEGYPLTLFLALLLEGGGGTYRGIKRQVIGFAVGRASLDIAPALAIGVGARTTTSALAVELV